MDLIRPVKRRMSVYLSCWLADLDFKTETLIGEPLCSMAYARKKRNQITVGSKPWLVELAMIAEWHVGSTQWSGITVDL